MPFVGKQFGPIAEADTAEPSQRSAAGFPSDAAQPHQKVHSDSAPGPHLPLVGIQATHRTGVAENKISKSFIWILQSSSNFFDILN